MTAEKMSKNFRGYFFRTLYTTKYY